MERLKQGRNPDAGLELERTAVAHEVNLLLHTEREVWRCMKQGNTGLLLTLPDQVDALSILRDQSESALFSTGRVQAYKVLMKVQASHRMLMARHSYE